MYMEIQWVTLYENMSQGMYEHLGPDQLSHPNSLIRAFTVRLQKFWIHVVWKVALHKAKMYYTFYKQCHIDKLFFVSTGNLLGFYFTSLQLVLSAVWRP